MPDGLIYQPQEERYRKDTATGITFGCDPKYTPTQQKCLEQRAHRQIIPFFIFNHGPARLQRHHATGMHRPL